MFWVVLLGGVTLVIYDVSDDRLRCAVASLLRRFGLSRIQRSAFAGVLSGAGRVELEAALRRLLRGRSGYNVQIFLITPGAFEGRVVLSEGYSLGGGGGEGDIFI